ncbi:hypothetical protein LWC34_52355 [Kibdelosporangium philippinense]|uniref:PLL-like beta propeller domain-containing protein n=1 Tax=Kibdelosporangium philippinense TaxID=211113 RepID=A0ABS8ZUH9_9PSEU|nr:hypothetical protein [Kibdelosporangium philippinense]MCE7011348.1 hypothetical protein [Kibdelosporangium philippinense]
MRGGLRRVASLVLASLTLGAGAVGTSNAESSILAAWHWADQGTPGNTTVAERVGAVSMRPPAGGQDNLVHTFVRGSDGNLWKNWWTGSSWVWSILGAPTSGVASSVGVIRYGDGFGGHLAYAFVRGGDGNLWRNTSVTGNSSWTNHGAPAGGIAEGIGAITVRDSPTANERPFVFVRGNDGNLWLNSWTGSHYVWSNQGTPGGGIIGTVGVMTVKDSPGGQERPYAFVRGGDGNLWLNWWSGNSWSWSNQGAPGGGIAAGVGTTGVRNSSGGAERPYAFVRGHDGNLWLNWWSGRAWAWSNQGAPAGGVSDGVGALTVDNQRPYAFVRAGDGNLWVHWWTGRAWNWANQGSVGSGIAGGLGVALVPDPSHKPYAFVRTNAGGLAVHWWE